MAWSDTVDLYCERTTADLWAEPFNAVTNAAFLVAAIIAFARAKDRVQRGFAVLVAVIGVGSALFHTLATRGAALGDVIPIFVFVHAYLFVALRRFLGVGLLGAMALTVAFIATAGAGNALVPRGVLNGGVGYVPPLLAMVGVGLACLRRGDGTAAPLLLAAGVFAVSLTFRSLDQSLCAMWPVGTHFVWHTLNAVVLFVIVDALSRTPNPPLAPVKGTR